MAGYILQPYEAFIREDSRVQHAVQKSTVVGELTLTTHNLVFRTKGIFGGTKELLIFPLNQVKVFNGQAQALVGKLLTGAPSVGVFFLQGQEQFGFDSKREARSWAQAINYTITGSNQVPNSDPGYPRHGQGTVADALRDTANAFKQAFGAAVVTPAAPPRTTPQPAAPARPAQAARPAPPPEPTHVGRDCNACGAPLAGIQGQIINCKYCDSAQKL